MMLRITRVTVTKSPITGEITEETVKTIARGMPGVSGVTVVTNARVYYTTRGCGRIGRPAFPAPSVWRDKVHAHNSGGSRREIAKVCVASSLRTQGPINTGLNYCAKAVKQRPSKQTPRRMGPRFRGDDV